MARIRLYLGKKQYAGYYTDVPHEVCTKKMKVKISSWSSDPINIPVEESMHALKGATVEFQEADFEVDTEAESPQSPPPANIKVGFYQLDAAPEKISAFCRKNNYSFVEASWPN